MKMRFRREGEDSGEDREMAKAEELAKGEKKDEQKIHKWAKL